MKPLAPFSLPGHWLKGNLHTHSTQSDGECSPEQAYDWYYEQGYDFMALTDHWVATAGHVVHEDLFLTLTGVELDGPGYHMLVLGIDHVPERELAESASELSTWVKNEGGLSYFAHPHWCGQTSQQIIAAPDITGIEVFNSDCDYGWDLGYGHVQWDEALEAGANLTGIAVDDAHWEQPYQGRGFIMVRTTVFDEAHILEAIRAGEFYCSTGPRISSVSVHETAKGRFLSVRCSPCQYITFHGANNKGRRIRATEKPIDGAKILIKDSQQYLRIECQDDKGEIAWTNAYLVHDLLAMDL